MKFAFDFGEPTSPKLKMVGRCPFCDEVLIRREWDVRTDGHAADQQAPEDALKFVKHLRVCPKAPSQCRLTPDCQRSLRATEGQ